MNIIITLAYTGKLLMNGLVNVESRIKLRSSAKFTANGLNVSVLQTTHAFKPIIGLSLKYVLH